MLKSKEIIFTGVESSGKTTLAQILSRLNNGIYVPEFARDYLKDIGTAYSPKDVENIAQGQAQRQKEIFAKFPFQKNIYLDTDTLVCKIWYEFKYKKSSPLIEALWKNQKADLYILCAIDIPWQEDPLRETPAQQTRQILFEMYENALLQAQRPYIIVQGDIEERLAQIQEAMAKL